jgi:hypothetical protein
MLLRHEHVQPHAHSFAQLGSQLATDGLADGLWRRFQPQQLLHPGKRSLKLRHRMRQRLLLLLLLSCRVAAAELQG